MKIALPLLVLLCAAPVLAVPLSITVVDGQGKPVAGADVQFESFGKSPRGFVLHQTDGQGTTTFEVEPMPHSLYGDFAGRVFARKSGFGIANGQLSFKTPSLRVELGASAKVGGTVVDGEGKPIPDVSVSFLSAEKQDIESDELIEGPLLPSMTAHSGADGKWQLDGVPTDAKIWLTVSAPGWVSQRSQILAGGTGEIVMSPGAQVKGRLLGLDGKPLAGIYVSAQGVRGSRDAQGGNTKTGADGTFTLDGMSGGTFNVSFSPELEAPAFVIPSFANVSASVGKPIQLPDAHAVEGVMISGRVFDSKTRAPMPGAMVGIYGGVNPASSPQVSTAIADENGVWKARTLPGESTIYVMGASQGFKRDEQEKKLVIGATGANDLDFALEPLPKITGRLLDENGKGIKASLQLRRDNEIFWASSDENGDLTAYGPTDGDWNISTQGEWDVVGPARVTVTADKPLEVRLKRLKLTTLELGVYDEDDAAVEGAHVMVNITTGEGDNRTMRQSELISDKTGRAHLDDLRTDQKVEIMSAKKEGYDTPALPKADHVGQLWSASVTLTKRSGRASGQVFGENGEVAASTRVSGSGIDTRSDGAGHFELAPLPKGITPVFAYRESGFALGSSDQKRLELKPQTLEPSDPAKAKAILDALSEQAKGVEYYRRESIPFEVGSFDELAGKLKQAPAKRGIETLLARFAGNRTIPAARWFEVLQSEKTAAQRLYSTSLWLKTGPTIAADDDSRRFLQALQKDVAEAEPQFKGDDKWMIAHGIFASAAVAEKIGDTQAADDLFERAQAFTEKAYGHESDRDYGIIGDIIAASPRLLLKGAALLPDTNGNRALMLAEGAPLLARSTGLDAAKPFLDQIHNSPPAKPDSYGDAPTIEYQWYGAVVNSIRASGKSNPSLALELAKSLPEATQGANENFRDTALCEAAFFQSPEIARELWSDALPRISADKAMGFVARILERDAPFARAQYETLARDMDARALPEYNASY